MDYPLDVYVHIVKYLDPTSLLNFIKFFSLVNIDKNICNDLLKYYILDYLSRDKLNQYIVNVYINLDKINTIKFYMLNYENIYNTMTKTPFMKPLNFKLSKILFNSLSNKIKEKKKSKKYNNLFVPLNRRFIYNEESLKYDKTLHKLIMKYIDIRKLE